MEPLASFPRFPNVSLGAVVLDSNVSHLHSNYLAFFIGKESQDIGIAPVLCIHAEKCQSSRSLQWLRMLLAPSHPLSDGSRNNVDYMQFASYPIRYPARSSY